MDIESSDLAFHYAYLPGWLYRAMLAGVVPHGILPTRTAIGLCWYEVSPGPRITERGDRMCSHCAEKAAELFPQCVIAKYLDTKVRTAQQAIAMGLSCRDHYCSICRATLYALRDATRTQYENIDDYLREVCVPNIEHVVQEQEINYDSGIEV